MMPSQTSNSNGPAAYRERVDALKSDLRAARIVADRAATAATAARANLAAATQARTIAQEVAAGVQQAAHAKIARVVTRCLASVFEDDAYEFTVKFEQRRGKTEAVLGFKRGDLELDDPIHQAGGGVVELAAFALRLSCLILSRPAVRPLLVLDEPLAKLSAGYIAKVRALLEILVEEFGVQVILVTHNEALACGKIIEVS